MVSKAKIAGIVIGAGAGVGALYYLIKAAAAKEEVLTLDISYTSIDGCAPDAPITFEGRYTVNGEGKDDVDIYIVNETADETFGPAPTADGGFYSLSSTAPSTVGTYEYRAYTEDQITL